MENAEEIFHFLEDFSKRKPKIIPQELNDYLAYVARTGDPVYQWSLVKSLFKEKLLNVITEFYETTPSIEIPPYPNVDPFNYDIMKNSLTERLDSFASAPFTVQRLCELLTYPRKQYNRVDKFMRAIEKNILVVSTREPGIQRQPEPENGDPAEPIVNGSDNNSEYNVDVEMEDMSWKEKAEQQQNSEPQPSSSDTRISVDDIEARLQAKQNAHMDIQEKTTTQYESVTPPELNVTTDEPEVKPSESSDTPPSEEHEKTEITTDTPIEPKVDEEMKPDVTPKESLVIPEIKVDDADMTEQRLSEESNKVEKSEEITETEEKETISPEEKVSEDIIQQNVIDESSSDSNMKEETEPKIISEVSTSSEESSSSSDNTDGNSNSPKTDNETNIDLQEESNPSDSNLEETKQPDPKESETTTEPTDVKENTQLQSDGYSISDVKSELPQPPSEPVEEQKTAEEKESIIEEKKEEPIVEKVESTETNIENQDA